MYRSDFPFFSQTVDPVIYLDSAATSQKPYTVLRALYDFYAYHNAPVHRGIYRLGEQATEKYEAARNAVARFIGAQSQEIIITKGTTEGINCVAATWAEQYLQAGDEIILTYLEHHANIVPWIRLAQQKGLVLRYVGLTSEGLLDYKGYTQLLTNRTKLVACTHTSNVLGCTLDIPLIRAQAHAVGARVLLDAAQSVAHQRLNVTELGVDFLVFSGHKMGGPTGIGVLYITHELLDLIEPYQVGGGMVHHVATHEASWAKSPARYEAGTPPIAQAVSLHAAIDYVAKIDFAQLKTYEAALCTQFILELRKIPKIQLLGPQEELMLSGHMVSFTVNGAHPHDVAAYLDTQNIAVRAGHQCAQPLHTYLGLDGSLRASFYMYTSHEEIERLVWALRAFCD